MSRIVAATGHRSKDIKEHLGSVQIKARVKLQKSEATRLICGMAEGFDLLAADAAMELGIPITVARPWAEHTAGRAWIDQYAAVMAYADKIHVVNTTFDKPRNFGEAAGWLHGRNHWMVDNADVVMAYWNGKQNGGTYECRQYAKNKGVPVANVFYDPPF